MKHFTIMALLSMFILSTVSAFSSGYTVTFNVDMKAKANAGLFDPTTDPIYVRGTFNGYGLTDQMTDGNNDSVYTISKILTESSYEFKFFFSDISGGPADRWEDAIGNRVLNLTSDTTLNLFFDSLVAAPVSFEFRANMKIKMKKGQFNASEDPLFVRGEFNGYSQADTLTDLDNDSIYTKTLTLLEGVGYQFKFMYVDVSGSTDKWETDPNRSIVVPNGGGSFQDYFDRDSIYNPPVDIEVTFTCNMELERASGRFDPNEDTVSVNGDFQGWTPKTTIMTPSLLNPDIYEKTVTIHAGEGDNIHFKFWYEDNNWESVSDRLYTFTEADAADQYAVYEASFNNGSLENVINQPCVVKFTVNTEGAVPTGGGSFPLINTVHIAGSSAPLQWPGGGWPNSDSGVVIQLFDDGSHGDMTASDGIFSRDVKIPSFTVLSTQYKYSINFGDTVNNGGFGNDNEAGFGQNHNLNLSRYSAGVTVVDTFGHMGNSAFETGNSILSVNSDWNLISVPRDVVDFSKNGLFPSSTSNAFLYDHGYTSQATLKAGNGYWLKFGGAESDTIFGGSLPGFTVEVTAGWNIVGVGSVPINVADITSDPEGIVTSQFFGYSGSYNNVTTLLPGQGYWVKVNNDGALTFSASDLASSSRIRIVPTDELPPSPPEVSGNEKPAVFALNQNFPNPFNPTTKIHYQLPIAGLVTLKVYNLLGEEIATLVNGVQDAGFKTFDWDAKGVPSGVYFYKLTAGTFNDTKKMVIMK